MTLPLADVRILAVEQFGAGPWATMQLADLGAEVIKVEDPTVGGDVARYVPPMQQDEDSVYFEAFNVTRWNIVVFGAGHVAHAVIDLLLTLDCRITCLDPREEWLARLPSSPKLTKVHATDMPSASVRWQGAGGGWNELERQRPDDALPLARGRRSRRLPPGPPPHAVGGPRHVALAAHRPYRIASLHHGQLTLLLSAVPAPGLLTRESSRFARQRRLPRLQPLAVPPNPATKGMPITSA